MFASDGKRWSDTTDQWKAGYGGWSWNAKFADVDNDGWQDLFIVQGTRLRLYNPSNVLLPQPRRTAAGGGDPRQRVSRTMCRRLRRCSSICNQDGDLDILTFPFQLTPVLWRNERPAGPGFEVRLDDQRTANRYGVGARVEIRSADGRLQVRDVKASGGHQSHDLLVARFGLGDWKGVSSIQVTWPDGESTELRADALGPGRYRVVRRAN